MIVQKASWIQEQTPQRGYKKKKKKKKKQVIPETRETAQTTSGSRDKTPTTPRTVSRSLVKSVKSATGKTVGERFPGKLPINRVNSQSAKLRNESAKLWFTARSVAPYTERKKRDGLGCRLRTHKHTHTHTHTHIRARTTRVKRGWDDGGRRSPRKNAMSRGPPLPRNNFRKKIHDNRDYRLWIPHASVLMPLLCPPRALLFTEPLRLWPLFPLFFSDEHLAAELLLPFLCFSTAWTRGIFPSSFAERTPKRRPRRANGGWARQIVAPWNTAASLKL